MKATCWIGKRQVRVEQVPDPKILNSRDAIVRITSTAICGSDLHLYNGFIPTMEKGDILGHEFMGEVVEVGSGVKNLKVGDRVVVPFTIACGNCWSCQKGTVLALRELQPERLDGRKALGPFSRRAFGYSHLTGGYAGRPGRVCAGALRRRGPAQGTRRASRRAGPLPVRHPSRPGYMGAEMCDIKPGDVIAVWGAGPVGQFAIASALLLGAERVIAIDRFPYRLRMAKERAGAPRPSTTKKSTCSRRSRR